MNIIGMTAGYVLKRIRPRRGFSEVSMSQFAHLSSVYLGGKTATTGEWIYSNLAMVNFANVTNSPQDKCDLGPIELLLQLMINRHQFAVNGRKDRLVVALPTRALTKDRKVWRRLLPTLICRV